MRQASVLLCAISWGCGALESEPAAPPEEPPLAIPAEPATEAPPEAAQVRVNLNTASDAELAAIPGITPKLAHEFEEYRPYVSISQFRKEIGKYVDGATVTAFEPYVYVPVDPNRSDAATLQQLGLSPEAAEAVIAARPFADRGAFRALLTTHLASEQVEAAEALLVAP